MFKTKQSGLPAYLHDVIHDYQPTGALCSSTTYQLQSATDFIFHRWSYLVATLNPWNSLS